MTRQQVQLGRVAIGALALVALVTQALVLPRVAAGYADAYPEVAYLQRPYVAAFVIAIVGLEAALFSAWQLLSGAKKGEDAPGRAKRWANILAGSLCFMAVVLAGVCVHAAFVANVGGPPTIFGLLVCLAVVPVAVVLRHRAVGFSLHGGADQTPLGHAH
jgi:fatty acid desaturase